MNTEKKGAFISFEGIDGSGKTTQIQRLAQWFEDKGHEVLSTRQPGGTPIGQAIRKVLLDPANTKLIPQSELLLYMADRLQHLHELILPARLQGKMVLCDRFHDATIAYQGAGRELDLTGIESIVNEWVIPHNPDHTFLLEISPEKGLERLQGRHDGERAEDRLDKESLDFFHQVAGCYEALAEAEPERFIRVDASGNPDEVFENIVQALPAHLK